MTRAKSLRTISHDLCVRGEAHWNEVAIMVFRQRARESGNSFIRHKLLPGMQRR